MKFMEKCKIIRNKYKLPSKIKMNSIFPNFYEELFEKTSFLNDKAPRIIDRLNYVIYNLVVPKCCICKTKGVEYLHRNTCSKKCMNILRSQQHTKYIKENGTEHLNAKQIKKTKIKNFGENFGNVIVKRGWERSKEKLNDIEFIQLTNIDIKEKLNEFLKTTKSQALYKSILQKDPNLFLNIDKIFENKLEVLSSKKFTEKIYRILNDDYEIWLCKKCNKYKYNFYTIENPTSNYLCKKCNKAGFSILSQELFFSIYDSLNDEEKKTKTNFAMLNNEKHIVLNDNEKEFVGIHHMFLDFIYSNKIIEFDGDYWHKNSKEKDDKKDTILKNRGYEILRIKESEYNKNKQICIKSCLTFLGHIDDYRK